MSIPKVIAGVAFNVALYAVLLFVPAGTLHWWRAWVFLAVTVAVMATAIFSILPDNADLLSQRAKGIIQKGQPLWDRILVILLVVSFVGQILFIPLDAFRCLSRWLWALRFGWDHMLLLCSPSFPSRCWQCGAYSRRDF